MSTVRSSSQSLKRHAHEKLPPLEAWTHFVLDPTSDFASQCSEVKSTELESASFLQMSARDVGLPAIVILDRVGTDAM